MLNALLDLVARPGLCGDVVQDAVEFIARIVTEATRRIDLWHWPADRAVTLDNGGPLLKLMDSAPLAHLSVDDLPTARTRIHSTLVRALLGPAGTVVSGAKNVDPSLQADLRS